MSLSSRKSVVAASLLSVVIAQIGTGTSGYEWVNPLIGTTNGGPPPFIKELKSTKSDHLQVMFSQAQRCLSVSEYIFTVWNNN
jgi:hypothetical protein